MKSAVIVYPGSNCDRDVAVALTSASGQQPAMIWHRETALPAVDLVVVPGGFSYGDYLRSGAMAAHSPIMAAVKSFAERGGLVLGICNGFQVLTESRLLPGALMRNASLKFICRTVPLRVDSDRPVFTRCYRPGQVVRFPVAHNEGAYHADEETLARLEGEGHVVFRYADESGAVTGDGNPNGSRNNIAGITNERGNVLGLMPHPERAVDPDHGGTDGRAMFEGLLEAAS